MEQKEKKLSYVTACESMCFCWCMHKNIKRYFVYAPAHGLQKKKKDLHCVFACATICVHVCVRILGRLLSLSLSDTCLVCL